MTLRYVLFLTSVICFQIPGVLAQSSLFDFKKVKNQSFTQRTIVVERDGKITQQGSMITTIKVDEKNNLLYQIRHTSGG